MNGSCESGEQVAHLAAEDLRIDPINYSSVDLVAERPCWLAEGPAKSFGERYRHWRQQPYSLAIGRAV
jgi:hypothetical protein